LLEAMMADESADSLSIREGRLEDIEAVLELWRHANATPGVTDTADDLRRAIADSPAHVLVAEVEGRPADFEKGNLTWRKSSGPPTP
jgi:hypothetical protein